MTTLERIREQLALANYKEESLSRVPRSLLWRPDLVVSKDGVNYLVLIKTNNSIPASFLDRIGRSITTKFVPLILFGKKLSSTDRSVIATLGINIGYFSRGRIYDLQIKKKRPKPEIRKEVKKKLEVIDIFISSRQDIAEREFILDRIEYLRKASAFPFNPPRLIEYDIFEIRKLYEHIKQVMSNCEWIVILLEDGFSKVVRYEIRQAIKLIRHKNIFMFVKSTKICRSKWKAVIKNIEITTKVKYLPYNDNTDLEVSLTRAITKRMEEIQKKKGVKIYV